MSSRHADMPAIAQQAAIIVALYELMTSNTAIYLNVPPDRLSLEKKSSACPLTALQLEVEIDEMSRLLKLYHDIELPEAAQIVLGRRS